MEYTTAGVEVAQAVEEVERMDEGEAPAVEEVVETESEEEEGPMRDGEGEASGDEQPADEAGAAIAGNPTGATYVVKFDANCNRTSNLVQGPERAALRPFRDSSTAVGQLLRRKQGADSAETIQFVAHAKLSHRVIVSRTAMDALAIVGNRAETAQLKIALAAIAGKKAADKKVAAKARAHKALGAANTKLKELVTAVAALEGKEPDDDQKAGIKAAKDKVAACALRLQRI